MNRFFVTTILLFLVGFAFTANAQSEFKLIASDGDSLDSFGRTVAVWDNYAVVGAPYDDNENGVDAGAAYVYKRSGTEWVQMVKLIASDGAADDLFGYDVDIYQQHIVVTAPWDDDAGEKSGAVYLFFRLSSTTYEERAKLTAADAGEDNRFGIAAAIDRDRLIVGAFFDDDFGYRSGSAYIFEYKNYRWSQKAKLTASDAAESDWFGVLVDIYDRYAVVGSRYNDNENGQDAGAVYVFHRNGEVWEEQKKLIASDGAKGDLFHVPALYGKYLVVGAYQDDDKGPNSGSVYVYKRERNDWNEVQKLVAGDEDSTTEARFGGSVAISGNRLVISAHGSDENGVESGAFYIFRHDGTEWVQSQKVIAEDVAEKDWFGGPVAIHLNLIVVGARYADDLGRNSGAAYAYYFTRGTLPVPSVYSTIAYAMSRANSGDFVALAPGTYSESFTMQAGVLLYGESSETVILSKRGETQIILGAEDATIQRVTIADNYNGMMQAGNGIISEDDNLTVRYCIIRDNNIGIYLTDHSRAKIYNNTIDNNLLYGLLMQVEPGPEIFNNIFTNNQEEAIRRNTAHSLGAPVIQYNCYFGNPVNYGYYGDPWEPEPGEGELFADPLFVGGTPFDYNLTAESPCIDAGDPNWLKDRDGTRADMGALFFDQSPHTWVEQNNVQLQDFALSPAYPNPFNPSTVINYSLPEPTHLTLKIYNMHGQEIRTLVNEFQSSGMKSVSWDGLDNNGNKVASGIYLYQLNTGKYSQARKMIMVQ